MDSDNIMHHHHLHCIVLTGWMCAVTEGGSFKGKNVGVSDVYCCHHPHCITSMGGCWMCTLTEGGWFMGRSMGVSDVCTIQDLVWVHHHHVLSLYHCSVSLLLSFIPCCHCISLLCGCGVSVPCSHVLLMWIIGCD